MGTTHSFYFIQNAGFTVDALHEKLGAFSKHAPSEFDKLMEAEIGLEVYAKLKEQVAAAHAFFDTALGREDRSLRERTVVAYCETAKWLPFFELNLCEGHIASGRDVKKLYRIFDAPVLSFAVFDSDVMFVIYWDGKSNRPLYYAKPNYIDFDEYDKATYSTELPAFIRDFCADDASDRLESIWESTAYSFAEDRLNDICALMHAKPLFDSGDIPKEFQGVFA